MVPMTDPSAPFPTLERPSTTWRQDRDEEAADLASGALPADDAVLQDLFPDDFLEGADTLLAAFEHAIAALPQGAAAHDGAWGALQTVVEGLNELNEQGDGEWIETDEREQLCEYFDEVLEAHQIDLGAFAATRKLEPHEITDAWREW